MTEHKKEEEPKHGEKKENPKHGEGKPVGDPPPPTPPDPGGD
jgi:hypothetical protein